MLGFFQKIIRDQLEQGFITSSEAEVIGLVINSMPEQDRLRLQSAIEAQPSLVPLFFENILEKAEARAADTVDAWKKVIDNETKQAEDIL